MVNFGLNSASLLGIVLYLAGATLCSLALWQPKLARYHDIFFSQVGWICGLIFLFQGWRLDPTLQLVQFILTATIFFSVFKILRLRERI